MYTESYLHNTKECRSNLWTSCASDWTLTGYVGSVSTLHVTESLTVVKWRSLQQHIVHCPLFEIYLIFTARLVVSLLWNLRPSGILRSVYWVFAIDVSVKPPETSATNYHSTAEKAEITTVLCSIFYWHHVDTRFDVTKTEPSKQLYCLWNLLLQSFEPRWVIVRLKHLKNTQTVCIIVINCDLYYYSFWNSCCCLRYAGWNINQLINYKLFLAFRTVLTQ
jgi:hypothetical protein